MTLEQPAQSFATRILAAITIENEDLQTGIDYAISRMDDRYWAYYVVQRFTWQRFQNWWSVRRWVQPRDVRRR